MNAKKARKARQERSLIISNFLERNGIGFSSLYVTATGPDVIVEFNSEKDRDNLQKIGQRFANVVENSRKAKK